MPIEYYFVKNFCDKYFLPFDRNDKLNLSLNTCFRGSVLLKDFSALLPFTAKVKPMQKKKIGFFSMNKIKILNFSCDLCDCKIKRIGNLFFSIFLNYLYQGIFLKYKQFYVRYSTPMGDCISSRLRHPN